MEPITIALPMSETMRIGRRGSRSTQTPMKRPAITAGAI